CRKSSPPPSRRPTVACFDGHRMALRLFSIACFLAAAVCFYQALPSAWKGESRSAPVREQSNGPNPSALRSAARPDNPRTKPIEQVDIFDRVLGKNPLLSTEERRTVEPDPATWRVLRLRMIKESGKLLDIKLARPGDWIEKAGIREGKSFFL